MLRSDCHREVNIQSLPRHQSIHTLRFPSKLWRIVNDCKTGAITWSNDGKSIVIDYTKFQLDYLTNRLGIFKTCNISSFIRQLNLYGFRKVSPHNRMVLKSQDPADIHLFRNESFLRDRPDLLQNVTRKTGPLSIRQVRRRPDQKNKLAHGMHSQGNSTTQRWVNSHINNHVRSKGRTSRSDEASDDPWLVNGMSCTACMGDADRCYQGCCSVEVPGLDIHQILDPSKSPKRVCLTLEEDNYSLENFFGLEPFNGEPLGDIYDIFVEDEAATDFHSDESFVEDMSKANSSDAADTDEKDLLSTAMQIAACFSGQYGGSVAHNPRGSSEPSDWNQLGLLSADLVDYEELSTMSDVVDIHGCTESAGDLGSSEFSTIAGSPIEQELYSGVCPSGLSAQF